MSTEAAKGITMAMAGQSEVFLYPHNLMIKTCDIVQIAKSSHKNFKQTDKLFERGFGKFRK